MSKAILLKKYLLLLLLGFLFVNTTLSAEVNVLEHPYSNTITSIDDVNCSISTSGIIDNCGGGFADYVFTMSWDQSTTTLTSFTINVETVAPQTFDLTSETPPFVRRFRVPIQEVIVVNGTAYGSNCSFQFNANANSSCIEICDNGIDDDGDGLVDCNDPDCGTNLAVNVAGNASICRGSSTTISANVGGGSGSYNYSWSNGLSNSSSHSVSPSNTTNYRVTVTDGNGCTATDNLNVTVNPNPTIIPYIRENGGGWQNTNAVTVCVGESFSLGSQSLPASGVTLTLPNGSTDGSPSGNTFFDFNNVSTSGAGTYILRYTDGNGCIATQNYNVTVNPIPNLDQYIGVNGGGLQRRNSITVCSGDELLLDMGGTFGSNWNFVFRRPDGTNISGGANGSDRDQVRLPTVIINRVNEGVWQVTYTDPNGCSRTENFTVNVDASSVGGTVSPVNQSICLGDDSVPIIHRLNTGYVGTVVRWEYRP
ncbi:MAG: hypothetical protein AB8G22_09535, partial [Saprospiraceae bacterium]